MSPGENDLVWLNLKDYYAGKQGQKGDIGERGEQGLQGERLWRGVFLINQINDYKQGDIVIHNTKHYQLIVETASAEPSDDSTDWLNLQTFYEGQQGIQGIQGSKGNEGEQGRSSYQGSYLLNLNSQYQQGDVVSHNGELWQLTTPTSGGTPNTEDGTSWVSLKGTSGSKGTKGESPYKGTWTVATQYEDGDIVKYLGVLYVLSCPGDLTTCDQGLPGVASEWQSLQVTGAQGLEGAQGSQGQKARDPIRGYYSAETTYESGDIVFYRAVADTEDRPYQYVCVQGQCQPGQPGSENTSWIALRGSDGVANDLLFAMLILGATILILITFLFIQLKWYYICCPPAKKRAGKRRDFANDEDSFWRQGDDYKYAGSYGAVTKGLVHDMYEPTLSVPDQGAGYAW